MVTAARLAVDLLANDAQLVDGFNRAATAVGRFAQSAQKDISHLSKEFDKLQRDITGIKGILGFAGFIHLTKSSLEAADSVEKLAFKLGLSTTEIQKYQYAAQQSGATNDDLLTSFNYLNRLIESGEVPYANLSEAINDIANRIQNAASGSERAAILFDVFGKSGIRLANMFKGGAEGLRQFGDQAEKIGAVLPEDVIKRAVEFKDQFETLGTVVTKNFQAGALSGFVDDSKKIKDIYTDPKFVESVRSLGESFGELAHLAIELAKVPSYLRAIAIEMPALAGKGIGNYLKTGSVNASFQRPQTVDHVTFLNKDGTEQTDKKPVTNNGATGSPRIHTPEPTSQLDKYIDSLNKETAAIGESERALFQQEAANKAANAAQQDFNNLLRDSAELTPVESQNIKDLAGKFYDLKEAQKQAEKFNEEFKSGFEDAAASVVNGSKSIGDALKDLVIQFAALIEKELILAPLANSIFGGSGSGGFGGLLAGLSGLSGFAGSQGAGARLFQTGSTSFVGPLPSFDKGTSYVPHDMTANIHRGEAVLTPEENAAWRKGGTSGDSYIINAPGASKADITQLKALVMSLAGPGRVEDRIKIATQRGSL